MKYIYIYVYDFLLNKGIQIIFNTCKWKANNSMVIYTESILNKFNNTPMAGNGKKHKGCCG